MRIAVRRLTEHRIGFCPTNPACRFLSDVSMKNEIANGSDGGSCRRQTRCTDSKFIITPRQSIVHKENQKALLFLRISAGFADRQKKRKRGEWEGNRFAADRLLKARNENGPGNSGIIEN